MICLDQRAGDYITCPDQKCTPVAWAGSIRSWIMPCSTVLVVANDVTQRYLDLASRSWGLLCLQLHFLWTWTAHFRWSWYANGTFLCAWKAQAALPLWFIPCITRCVTFHFTQSLFILSKIEQWIHSSMLIRFLRSTNRIALAFRWQFYLGCTLARNVQITLKKF